MGNCGSSSEEGTINKRINKKIRREAKKEKFLVKLLLLGAGESGKSTIFKQLRLIHKNGYSEEETAQFTGIVHNNVLRGICDLSRGAATLQIDVSTVESEINEVTSADQLNLIPPDLGETVKKLFASEPMQATWSLRHKLQVNESFEYFVGRLDEIVKESYTPSKEDILRSRVRTTGICDMSFKIDQVPFLIVDVGGQRSERRKWIHCFADVTAVIFVAALSEYDQVLFEDSRTNRVEEALTVFADVCNNQCFAKTSMILFLNKRDLFEKKVVSVPLSDSFPEYDGGPDYDAGVEFIKQKFVNLNANPTERLVYTHITCATDTDNVTFVFNSVKDIILNANVAGSGMT